MKRGEAQHEAYSIPTIAPLYPSIPYEYDTEGILIGYEITSEVADDVLPAPFEVPDAPQCMLWNVTHYRSSGLGSYNELIVSVTADYDGETVSYSPYMFLDEEVPICAGREIWGYPKKQAAIEIEGDRNMHTARHQRGGVTVLEAIMQQKRYVEPDDMPIGIPESKLAAWKRIPSAPQDEPPAVDRIVMGLLRDIDVRWVMEGPAEVDFGNSAPDPLSVFEPVDDPTGYYFDMSWVLDTAEEGVVHTFDEYRP